MVEIVKAVLFTSLLATPSQTWIVDASGNGDFTDIQSAIDASSDGDLILVRTGTYAGFVLDRKVTIKAALERFTVVMPALIHAIQPGPGGATVSGMKPTWLEDASPFLLEVSDCAGDVVLEDIEFEEYAYIHLEIVISDCASVSLDDFETSGVPFPWLDDWPATPVLTILRSNVRASGLRVIGTFGVDYSDPPQDGQTAVVISDSSVVIASPEIEGGKGSSDYWCGGRPRYAGNGGIGIVATRSTVLLIGKGEHFVTGGDGGHVSNCGWGDYDVGEPGLGMKLDASSVIVSRVTITDGHDSDYPDWEGDELVRDNTYPFLMLDPPLRTGELTTLVVNTQSPGSAIVLVSDQGGIDSAGSKWLGPPLSVLPGLVFEVADLGRGDHNNNHRAQLRVPDDPALVGLTYHVQGATFADSGALHLTNAIARTVGE
jgi:hypothetical protein